jgi:hypothetical protein
MDDIQVDLFANVDALAFTRPEGGYSVITRDARKDVDSLAECGPAAKAMGADSLEFRWPTGGRT